MKNETEIIFREIRFIDLHEHGNTLVVTLLEQAGFDLAGRIGRYPEVIKTYAKTRDQEVDDLRGNEMVFFQNRNWQKDPEFQAIKYQISSVRRVCEIEIKREDGSSRRLKLLPITEPEIAIDGQRMIRQKLLQNGFDEQGLLEWFSDPNLFEVGAKVYIQDPEWRFSPEFAQIRAVRSTEI